jgi:bifunctional N-acetylglucosamine-1-phosphate-uridyltransferase/glucosamine-1-phosphate-acetyltransferase GlmU-like protein
MTRALVIPAAGRGSRLSWNGPKALCPVAGRPMLDRLLDLYAPFVDRAIIVAAPAAAGDFAQRLANAPLAVSIAVQAEPLGMLPAILCARQALLDEPSSEVWITWCDQIGISPHTLERLGAELAEHREAALVAPTVRQSPPYVHFARDARGRIAGVLQRRDGDDMPQTGESDTGLFALRADTWAVDLVAYAAVAPLAPTGERNFLPFIPWLAARKPVHTFELPDAREALGVNTPADLAQMEQYLSEHA